MNEFFGRGVWFDEKSNTMRGSNFPIAARIDSILRPLGIRVANLADLCRPEIVNMIEGRYSDIPSLVLRTLEDGYEPNNVIIKGLVPHIEDKQGRLQLPVMISGLDVVILEDNKGYGWNVVPRDDFNVMYDKRLEGKYGAMRFSKVDERNLPLFEENGERRWYARDQGLSGLFLDGDLDLYSGIEGLADSNEYGR